VLKLAFVDNSGRTYTLIIRSHPTKKEAENEKENAHKLGVSSADCFANLVEVEKLESKLPKRYLVIYEYVTVNTVGDPVYQLDESLSQYILEPSIEEIKRVAGNFQEFIKRLTRSYEGIEGMYQTIASQEYCQSILSQLPPDLVINGACFDKLTSGVLLVKPQDGDENKVPNRSRLNYMLTHLMRGIFHTSPIEVSKIETISITQVAQSQSDWIRFEEKFQFEEQTPLTGESETAYLPLKMVDKMPPVRIWIGIDKAKCNNIIKLDTEKQYELICRGKDLVQFTTMLEKMGFDSQACLSIADFQDLCEQLNLCLHRNMRQSDLHCGNLLASGGSFKVIDVGDMEMSLLTSDIARLEVSIWFELSKQFISPEEAKLVIENKEPSDTLSPKALILSLLIYKLNHGFKEGVLHNNLPEKFEIELAYVTQILLYQRYCLLDGLEKIPPAFSIFAAHWLRQFRDSRNVPQPPVEQPPVTTKSEDTEKKTKPSKGLRVVLIYKRRDQLDKQLLNLLEEHLSKAGYSVFIDRHLRIGDDWERQISAEIKQADAVVILLSSTSVYSETLAYEVNVAYQTAQENSAKPRLLPIRINFEEPLPQDLSNMLGNLQYALWRSPDDDVPLVNELLEKLKSPLSPKKYELEMVGGAIPLDSKFYVKRQVDGDFQTAIERRDTIVLLKGARQVGKTSLLARGLQTAREAGMHVLLTDFQKLIDAQLQNLETFFLAIGEMLADQLDLEVYPQDKWRSHRAPNMNFDHYFRREILAKTQQPLLWAIDEADRLFSCNFSSEVFSLFRTWHNDRALNPNSPCSQLTLAIAYATETYLFIKDQNQSPFNVGTKLELEDFTLEQVADLNQRYGSPLRDETELRHFNQLVGGQPYLVRCGLNDIVFHNKTLDEFISTADQDDKAFGDHLHRIVRLLNRDPQLSEVMRGVLRGEACPDYDSFYRLRSAGILRGDAKNDVRPRCEIYATYLKKHLL